MEELLNIYNEDLEQIGVESRSEIHKKGLRHKVVHCWFVERDNEDTFIYFQQRSFNKADFPGMYDIACAGHIDAGEEAENAMIRELREEVGLIASKDNLKYIGRKFETFNKNEFLDNEICEMYILEVNKNNHFTLGEEVEDLVKVSQKEYKNWIEGESRLLTAQSICGNEKVEIHEDNICPHIKEYNYELFKNI